MLWFIQFDFREVLQFHAKSSLWNICQPFSVLMGKTKFKTLAYVLSCIFYPVYTDQNHLDCNLDSYLDRKKFSGVNTRSGS